MKLLSSEINCKDVHRFSLDKEDKRRNQKVYKETSNLVDFQQQFQLNKNLLLFLRDDKMRENFESNETTD